MKTISSKKQYRWNEDLGVDKWNKDCWRSAIQLVGGTFSFRRKCGKILVEALNAEIEKEKKETLQLTEAVEVDHGCSVPYHLVILKGVMEHGDGTIYFGSTGAYSYYESLAFAARVLRRDGNTATLKGREVYEKWGLNKLPKNPGSRAYSWDWSVTNIPESEWWR